MEILAPAGGWEAMSAAVRAGADAVYFGTQRFNARRNAQNFSDETLDEAIRFCHARGVKVYITLNTLAQDEEQDALCEEIERIAKAGADGLIVQDLSVAKLVRECAPGLPLHASTQMSVHNLSGVRQLEKMGFTRVVLARELSLEEIRAIASQTRLQIEIFVHGALCMSVSGQCYLSALIGGRSGNRGLCAQPCRLNFKNAQRSSTLSLKDLSLLDRMDEVRQSGAFSLKIEGRMKRPEYVAAVTGACREALEGQKPDMDHLRAVFSRSGFTNGYFTARRRADMFGVRTKEDVVQGQEVFSSINACYRKERKCAAVDMALTVRDGQPMTLTANDGERTVTVSGAVPEIARTRDIDEAFAEKALSKTGDTPFAAGKITLSADAGLTAPMSALNALRKSALDELMALRGETKPHAADRAKMAAIVSEAKAADHQSPSEPGLRLRFADLAQIPDGVEAIASQVVLQAEQITEKEIGRFGDALIAELPALIYGEDEDKWAARLDALKAMGLSHVMAGNLGTVTLAKNAGLVVHGDYGLNLLNSAALCEAEALGLSDATLSFEGRLPRLKALGSKLPVGVIGYGHLPLMLLRCCPNQGDKGCGACRGFGEMTDRTGAIFRTVCRDRKYTVLYNAPVLSVADKKDSLRGLDFVTMYFTFEDADEVRAAIADFRAGRMPSEDYTRGLYFRALQ